MTEIQQQAPVRSRMISPILSVAALVVLVAGARTFSDQLGPLVLGFVIVITVLPVRTKLIAIGVPALIATTIGFFAAIGIVVGLVFSLIWCAAQVTSFVRDPESQEAFSAEQERVLAWASEAGLDGSFILDQLAGLDLSSIVGTVETAVSGVFGVLTALSVVLIAMFFMMLDAGPMAARVRELGAANPMVGRGLDDMIQRTRSYMVVTALFGAIVALLDGAFLWAMGIPLVWVWVVLSFVTNFIPNIGFVLGVIPPAIVALLTQGPEVAFWVIVGYSVLNFVIQSLIQPRFVGDSVGLSTTLTFISLVFWSFIMGPLGSILAVPLTLFAKTLLVDIDPNLQWLRPLISLRKDDGVDLDIDGQQEPGEVESAESPEAAESENAEDSKTARA